jgi:protein TonB
MMSRRRFFLLMTSAALHAAAVVALAVIAGSGAGSTLFVDLGAVDLVAGAEGPAGDASPGRTAAATPRAKAPGPARKAPVPRAPAAALPAVSSAVPAESQPPPAAEKFELSREAPVPEGALRAAEQPASSARAVEAAADGADSRGGASRTAAEGGGVAGAGGAGALLALAVPGDGRGGVPAEYGPYLARFRQRIQEALVYPLAARRQGLSGTVELEVLMDPTGRIRGVQLVSSSSHGVLDEAALETVRGLAPLPLPEYLPRRPLKIRLPVVYRLR